MHHAKFHPEQTGKQSDNLDDDASLQATECGGPHKPAEEGILLHPGASVKSSPQEATITQPLPLPPTAPGAYFHLLTAVKRLAPEEAHPLVKTNVKKFLREKLSDLRRPTKLPSQKNWMSNSMSTSCHPSK
ncbi:uncharacterized protein LOC135385157 isoform X1 [Ornithodoros turicata]|uniref:uncharacterized protein LOC135385157 isoform X1 n=1 Tax=Ornithodoros turicata TaxID=34597 RepID=UPI00313876BD